MANPISTQCSTGVPGLDDILSGGLPRACLHLIEGNPGVGKTTLAMQFLLEGRRQGEAGLYVALSETKQELEAVAASHGWDLGGISIIELSAVDRLIGEQRTNTLFQSAEVELNQLISLLVHELERLAPQRVVFDSLSEMRLLAQSTLRFRREILKLKQRVAQFRCTVLLLDERGMQGSDAQMHSLVHGAILLNAAPLGYGVFRRSLSITKIRGVRFREGTHDYLIDRGGLRVFPRLIAAEHHSEFARASATSGNAELDALLGEGLHYGTSNLLIGPAGSGKSTLAAMFAQAAAGRGERVNYYVFDETTATLCARAKSMHLDLHPHLHSGVLKIEQVDPASISPGELAFNIRRAVEEDNARVIVIDSLNGYMTGMPHEEFLHLHMHELLTYLNQQGVMTIMILAQHGLVGAMGTPVDVSYLADSVILTRFFELQGNVRKAISIIKKRSGPHESSIRELMMTSDGVNVGPPLTEFQGVLTGVPTYLGGGKEVTSYL